MVDPGNWVGICLRVSVSRFGMLWVVANPMFWDPVIEARAQNFALWFGWINGSSEIKVSRPVLIGKTLGKDRGDGNSSQRELQNRCKNCCNPMTQRRVVIRFVKWSIFLPNQRSDPGISLEIELLSSIILNWTSLYRKFIEPHNFWNSIHVALLCKTL